MCISDWSSDVCSSDLRGLGQRRSGRTAAWRGFRSSAGSELVAEDFGRPAGECALTELRFIFGAKGGAFVGFGGVGGRFGGLVLRSARKVNEAGTAMAAQSTEEHTIGHQ